MLIEQPLVVSTVQLPDINHPRVSTFGVVPALVRVFHPAEATVPKQTDQ